MNIDPLDYLASFQGINAIQILSYSWNSTNQRFWKDRQRHAQSRCWYKDKTLCTKLSCEFVG